MKKNIKKVFILILIFSSSLIAAAGSPAIDLLNSFDKEGKFLIQYNIDSEKRIKDSSLNFTSYKRYLRGTSEIAIALSLPITVHEMSHFYSMNEGYFKEQKYFSNYKLEEAAGFHYYNIYLPSGEPVLVRKTITFSSEEISKLVPDFIRGQRYRIYISRPNKIQSTKVDGVYGLLDEMNAYTIGGNTFIRMVPVFEKQNNPKYWMNYFSGFYSNLQGAYEFRYFVLEYLLYAKQNYPEHYKKIISNRNFKYAFNEIVIEMDNLYENFERDKQQIFKKYSTDGNKFYQEKNRINLNTSNTKWYVDTVEDNIVRIKNHISNKKYNDILKLLKSEDGVVPDNIVLKNTVLPPVIDLKIDGQNILITLLSSTKGSKIYYTLDKKDPRIRKGTLYQNPFSIPIPRSGRVDLKVYAEKSEMFDSNMDYIYYTIRSK